MYLLLKGFIQNKQYGVKDDCVSICEKCTYVFQDIVVWLDIFHNDIYTFLHLKKKYILYAHNINAKCLTCNH